MDDDSDVVAALAFWFGTEGFDVHTFQNAEALLESGNLPSRACLVLDYRLPGMTGLDLLQRLRGRGVTLPAVLVTTAAGDSVRGRAAAMGASFIEKPFLSDDLLQTVRHLLASNPSPEGH